jgi:hypothetical protein
MTPRKRRRRKPPLPDLHCRDCGGPPRPERLKRRAVRFVEVGGGAVEAFLGFARLQCADCGGLRFLRGSPARK